jgi:type III pantothenate kinase
MINLVIDVGNSFTKVAIFDNREIVDLFKFDQFAVDNLPGVVKRRVIDHAIISTVDQDVESLEEYLKSKYNYIRFHTGIHSNIINHYKTPQTLGLDRFAAVIGAAAVLPVKNCLIIDAGTCITYDFVDKDMNYWGGSISPGLSMRFKAVNTFTERLPLFEYDPEFNSYYGTETKSAILSGIQQGLVHEALGFIQDYASNYSDLHVILCGGDVKFFDTRLKNSIFADSLKTEPQLVLIGLNEVIHQNTND